MLSLAGALLGIAGLIGWFTDSSVLTAWIPGLPGTKANTALALALLGVAAALRSRKTVKPVHKALALAAAAFVLAIGIATLVEYAAPLDLRVGQLLLGADAVPHAGRSSPHTALSLALLALAILLYDVRIGPHARPAEWLVLTAAATAFTGLMGLALGTGPLYEVTHTPIAGAALPTALALLLICAGLLLEGPATGLMTALTSKGPGGVLFRRLALLAVVAPVLFGLVITRVSAAVGLDHIAVVAAVLSSTMTVSILVLLKVTAASLDRAHRDLESSRAQTHSLFEQAPEGIFVTDLEGHYTDVNDAGCRIVGRAREELIGKSFADTIPPEDVDRVWQVRQELLAGGIRFGEWRAVHKDGSYVPVEGSGKILPDGRWYGFVRDISERKRLEQLAREAAERQRESEERFRLAIDNAPIGMALVALDGRFARVNHALCEIVGYSPEELHGLTFQSITHPDDVQADLDYADRLRGGEITRYQREKRYLHKDGSSVDVMLSVSILRSRSGQPLYFVSQVEDISERKRLAAELKMSELKSTRILDISADAIISIDEQQRIISFNEGAEHIFGYTKPEVIGTPLERLMPERFRAGHRQHVKGFAHGRQIARRLGDGGKTIMGLRKDGREFPADATVSKVDVGGHQILTVALRDSTEEKRVQNEQRFLADVGALLATNLQYEQTIVRFAELAVRQIADVCIVDVMANDAGVHRIQVVSRGPAEPPARDVQELTTREADALRRRRSGLATGRPMLIADAASQPLAGWARSLGAKSLMAVPLVVHDALLGMVTFISVSPARRYGPADLRLAEELAHRAALSIENARLYSAAARAIEDRDEVLGIVAHDLRNPLGSVLMQAAMLRHAGPDEHRAAKAADRIERSATRMNRLIQDLLDVTRMEAGRLSIRRDSLKTAQLVSEAIDAQRSLAAASSLDLRLDLAPELPEVWADRDRLLQVFENLIGNALKFTQPGGSVTLGATPRAQEVLFWVADDGPGVSADDLPHVFDRFWQARKTGQHGAGLGLPIVKGIVQTHGGHVWLESPPGRGSTFFFTIPTPPRAAALLPASTPNAH